MVLYDVYYRTKGVEHKGDEYLDSSLKVFVGVCFAANATRAAILAHEDISSHTNEFVSPVAFDITPLREVLGTFSHFVPHYPTLTSLFGYTRRAINR